MINKAMKNTQIKPITNDKCKKHNETTMNKTTRTDNNEKPHESITTKKQNNETDKPERLQVPLPSCTCRVVQHTLLWRRLAYLG